MRWTRYLPELKRFQRALEKVDWSSLSQMFWQCLTGSQWSDLRSGLASVRPPRWQTTLAPGMGAAVQECLSAIVFRVVPRKI